MGSQEEGIKLFGATIRLNCDRDRQQKEEESKTIFENPSNDSSNSLNSSSVVDHNIIMKRPEKIIPCPRCKSMDTKFCYFNNYNVNQPRHFCKSCQRYWTAGGALRNVPVGAGRRKTKIPGHGGVSCVLDGFGGGGSGVGVEQFEFGGGDGVVVMEEWQVAAHGGLQHVKRRRSDASGVLQS